MKDKVIEDIMKLLYTKIYRALYPEGLLDE